MVWIAAEAMVFSFLVFICFGGMGECVDINDARNLQTYLFTNYTSDHRPLYNQSERIQLSAIFYLLDITDFDDVRQEFICNGLFTITWKDEFLVWNTGDFGGLNHFTFVNEYKCWFPKISLTNTLDKRNVFEEDTQRMSVYDNGTVMWLPTAIFKTSCPLNVHLFPFDVQRCEIHMMAVHYLDDEVELVTGSDVVELVRFQENGQWEILETVFDTIRLANISKWRVSIKFQRRPLFYILNVIIPIMLLSFLNMAVFAIPAQSGEKLSFSVTLLLSLVVYMTFVSGLMPKSSTSNAMLTGYLTTVTASSAVNVVFTILVLRFHNKEREETVPLWLRKVVRGVCVGPKTTHSDNGTDNVSSTVEWGDVSKALDYILLRTSLIGLILMTTGFFIVLVTSTD